MKLAAQMKFAMAAGNVAAAAAAASVSSTSDGPLPAQSSPSQQDPAGKAPALPAAKPPASSAISMTAALKNVGAVSIHLNHLSHTTAWIQRSVLFILHFVFGR